jgi:hypothetical protein
MSSRQLIPPHHRIFSFDEPITVTLLTFLIVVFLARAISYLVIEQQALPHALFVTIEGYRLHHFVYGNFIILVIGFLKIVLGLKIPPRFAALVYGVGLGLVIDEFALWSGAIRYLGPGSLQVFNAVNVSAVMVVTVILLAIMYARTR